MRYSDASRISSNGLQAKLEWRTGRLHQRGAPAVPQPHREPSGRGGSSPRNSFCFASISVLMSGRWTDPRQCLRNIHHRNRLSACTGSRIGVFPISVTDQGPASTPTTGTDRTEVLPRQQASQVNSGLDWDSGSRRIRGGKQRNIEGPARA